MRAVAWERAIRRDQRLRAPNLPGTRLHRASALKKAGVNLSIWIGRRHWLAENQDGGNIILRRDRAFRALSEWSGHRNYNDQLFPDCSPLKSERMLSKEIVVKRLLGIGLLAISTLTANKAAEVWINIGPPPPPREVVVARPGPRYVWVPGHYH
jgi:hypothetical protein